ncbi:M56 family metallopeptidase [Acidobacteria bacterium AB60]|nr:M56 family metallopeptidase [Acidobacteria bacterium AB60]
MNAFYPLLSHLSAQATGALISAVWQGALLAALVGVILRVFPGLSAAARSVIWFNVFILLALLHLIALSPAPFALGDSAAPHLASHALQLDARWSLVVAALWLGLSLVRAVQLVVSALHLHALAGRAIPVDADPYLNPLLLAPFRRRVQLCASAEVARPSVLGFFRPRILVPPQVLENLSPTELRQVVIHEMEHLRRGDDWTNLLQKLALVVFPLNPALLWVERQLCTERELACDDRVLRSGSGRKAYALCLTHLAEFSLIQKGFSLVLGAWERRPELVRRVHRILSQPVRTMGRKPALALTGAVLSGLFAGALTLAHAPQLVGFVSASAPAQTAQLPSGVDTVSGPTLISNTGSGEIRAVNAVLRTGATQSSGTAYARNIALKARPSKTALPCPIKLAHKHRKLPNLQPERLAALRTPPAPAPADTTAFLVVAQTATQDAAFNTLAHIRQPHRIIAVSAVYLVRTPAGWVIIQI